MGKVEVIRKCFNRFPIWLYLMDYMALQFITNVLIITLKVFYEMIKKKKITTWWPNHQSAESIYI